jgi:hypothetical protein
MVMAFIRPLPGKSNRAHGGPSTLDVDALEAFWRRAIDGAAAPVDPWEAVSRLPRIIREIRRLRRTEYGARLVLEAIDARDPVLLVRQVERLRAYINMDREAPDEPESDPRG